MRPGRGLVFRVGGVDRRPDPTCQTDLCRQTLLVTPMPYSTMQKGKGGALARVRVRTLSGGRKEGRKESNRTLGTAQRCPVTPKREEEAGGVNSVKGVKGFVERRADPQLLSGVTETMRPVRTRLSDCKQECQTIDGAARKSEGEDCSLLLAPEQSKVKNFQLSTLARDNAHPRAPCK